MTPNAKWSLRVAEMDRGLCAAQQHDPRCRGLGEHAHHICYKSHIPKACYWVVENGIWLSLLCHDLAHDTHNASLPKARRDRAIAAMRTAIAAKFPHKPELLVKLEAA